MNSEFQMKKHERIIRAKEQNVEGVEVNSYHLILAFFKRRQVFKK
jgi:hypothetical protein